MIALEERSRANSTGLPSQFGQSVLIGAVQAIQIGNVAVQGFNAKRMHGIAFVKSPGVATGECAQDCLVDEVGHQQQANGCAGGDDDQVLCLHVLCSSVEPAAGILGERPVAGCCFGFSYRVASYSGTSLIAPLIFVRTAL
ncbi:hypothetical protein D3C81_920380 [compost metagenome]